jgi:hypothetical protein
VDQATQRAIVKAETCSTIETEEARGTEGADAVGIERERILKRRIAGGAEVVGFERNGGIQAVDTDRNTSKPIKRKVADAALGGENERKNSVGDRPKGGNGRSRQQTTREGAPP